MTNGRGGLRRAFGRRTIRDQPPVCQSSRRRRATTRRDRRASALARKVRRSTGSAGQTRTARIRKQRSEEHTSELQSLMHISYAVFCLKKKNNTIRNNKTHSTSTYTQ